MSEKTEQSTPTPEGWCRDPNWFAGEKRYHRHGKDGGRYPHTLVAYDNGTYCVDITVLDAEGVGGVFLGPFDNWRLAEIAYDAVTGCGTTIHIRVDDEEDEQAMKPKFENSSGARVFLGHFNGADLYFDPQVGIPTVISRFGNAPQEYTSGLAFAETSPHIAEAKRRAIAKGLLLDPEILSLGDGWQPLCKGLDPYLSKKAGDFKLRIKPTEGPHGWAWEILQGEDTLASGRAGFPWRAEAALNALVPLYESDR